MAVTRRIFVSMPADAWLTAAANELKWGIVERIEQLGYTPEIFFDPTGRDSLSAGLVWSPDTADDIMRRCSGAALIGLPRWTFGVGGETVLLPTEYCHYEGALAQSLGLPLLILAHENLLPRVVFAPSFGLIGTFPEGADRSWLDTKAFEVPFTHWRTQLERRRDVFLGYSGASAETGDRVRGFLEDDLGATVLDWRRDFTPGRTILEEIEEARARCTTGIFLFTGVDELSGSKGEPQAVPRDNVVFEAGYFAGAKGKKRVLVILERGTKLPADLGGDIYASLEDRADLSSVEESVRRFLADL